ncbi:MAG: Sapep family Mn(2+)-dependent dipeptidase [Christensenellaceae bacterium]|jgi:succinyl-diaminopimelate desuccinylase|nr:Sapep family Mn(2+)-dependent dipeptidase [Christensenellaceae bacterium]
MSSETRKSVRAWLEEKRPQIVRDILRLARIPSISDSGAQPGPYGKACRDVLDEALKLGAELGFFTQNYDYKVGALWLGEGETAPGSIGIWGHLDVVPPGEGWLHAQPFSPIEKEGYLIGRGVADNKGPAVGALYAALAMKELGLRPAKPLRIFLGCSEETGMDDATHYVANYEAPALSLVADGSFPVGFAEKGIIEIKLLGDAPLSEAVLALRGGQASNIVPDLAEIELKAGEALTEKLQKGLPDGLEAEHGEKSVKIRAHGVASHSARPEGGVNAIQKLLRGLFFAGILGDGDENALAFLLKAGIGLNGFGFGIACEDEISGALTSVGSLLSLDEQRRPVLQFNIRYPVTAKLEELLAGIAKACERGAYKAQLVQANKPNHFPKESPVVKALTKAFNEVAGAQAEPYAMSGGTYARKLPNGLVFGMGLPKGLGHAQDPALFPPGHGGAHAPDEALYVDDLLKGIEIYILALAEWTGEL